MRTIESIEQGPSPRSRPPCRVSLRISRRRYHAPPHLKSGSAPAQRHAGPYSCLPEPAARPCSTHSSSWASSIAIAVFLGIPRRLNCSSRARHRRRKFPGRSPTHAASLRRSSRCRSHRVITRCPAWLSLDDAGPKWLILLTVFVFDHALITIVHRAHCRCAGGGRPNGRCMCFRLAFSSAE